MSLQDLLRSSTNKSQPKVDKEYMTASDMGDALIEFDDISRIKEWFVYVSTDKKLQLIDLSSGDMLTAIKVSITMGSNVLRLSRTRGIVQGAEVAECIRRAAQNQILEFDRETSKTYHFKTT